MRLRNRIAVALAAMAVAGATFAQGAPGFPSRPFRLIVASAPGGTQDTVGRIVAEGLSERLGQPVVADNRGGAAGVIGCEIAAQSNPDGHTMVIVSASYGVHPSVRKQMPYDSLRDLAPVGRRTAGDPQTQKRLRARGIEPSQVTSEEFAALLRKEIPKWAKVMKAAGVQPQ